MSSEENPDKSFQSDEYLQVKCSEIVDKYLDVTFHGNPSIVDNDDLKVNGLMVWTVATYQILFVVIALALFTTTYLNEVSVIYLSPYTDNKNEYCTVIPIEITGNFWIDKQGNFEGSANFDASKTIYRIVMKNMKITTEDYQKMIDTFEKDIKKVAATAAKRDASYNYAVYSSYNTRYFPESGGTVDFYFSGDASIIFNADYDPTSLFFVSRTGVCTPSNISIDYERSSIIPAFPIHYSMPPPPPTPYIEKSPTVAPTNPIIPNPDPFIQPYILSSSRRDYFKFKVCKPGVYTFDDCDCSGDTSLYIYSDRYSEFKDDGCEGPNLCSKITYSNTDNSCTNMYLSIYDRNDVGDVKGNLTLFGPEIRDVRFDSYIMCIGDISNACMLTCPDSSQDIGYIYYAKWGIGNHNAYSEDYNPQCDDSTTSANLETIAERDCVYENSCAIFPDANAITTQCTSAKSYILAVCQSSKITTSFIQPYILSSSRNDRFNFRVCKPGVYTFDDCDCSGDTFFQAYVYSGQQSYSGFSKDDGCGGSNLCSKITYSHTDNSCTTIDLSIYYRNAIGDVKGNLTLLGPEIRDVRFDSKIMCIGDISNACMLTCPDSSQYIGYIYYAKWGIGNHNAYSEDYNPQCDDSTTSANLETIAKRDCVNENSCAIFPDANAITTQCTSANSYVAALCFGPSFRRRLELEPDTVLKEATNQITENALREKMVSSKEEKAEVILNRRLAEMTLRLRVTEETRKHRRNRDRILNHRRLTSASQQTLKQPCYNDVDDKYILKIGGYIEGYYEEYNEIFKDNGNSKAIGSFDVRSLATVIAVNSGLVSTELLTQTGSFAELFESGEIDFEVYDFSDADMENLNTIAERKMAYYVDDFYDGMDSILCAKVNTKNSREVDVCALVTDDGTNVVPVISSEGIRDAIKNYIDPKYQDDFYYVESGDYLYTSLKEKLCLFQLSRVRCDRFSDEKCELDPLNVDYDRFGEGYNNFLLGLIYVSQDDLKNNAALGNILEWQDILLNQVSKDYVNYDDNFQSAAYDIMSTYEYTNMFTSLKTDDGSYDYAAHKNAMHTTFYGYLKSTLYPVYSSSTCPATYSQYLKIKFDELCMDIKCKMMVLTYKKEPKGVLDNYLGNFVGTGTARFKTGDRSKYYDQLYDPVPFKKIRSTPPLKLVDNVVLCRQNPSSIFWNTVGITYSNSQLIVGIIFAFILSAIVKVWNRQKNTTKVYSISKKSYLHKQVISAALNCLKDRLNQIEEKIGCTNDTNIKSTSELFNEILAVSDLVDQVDDIKPRELIETIKSMNISHPISVHRAIIQERRKSKKSMRRSNRIRIESDVPTNKDRDLNM